MSLDFRTTFENKTLESNKSLKRFMLRVEHIQRRHYGIKFKAYILINMRRFYGT